MSKLIVHADDFGLRENINEGCILAHRDGILTSVSIMANGHAFDHAITLLSKAPDLDVGVHLALIEEKPLLNQELVSTLVDDSGKFYPHATHFMKRYFWGKIDIGQVEQELEAQIIKVKSRGVKISHLDSHQHIHVLPQILKVVVKLAKKYNVPFIRLPQEGFTVKRAGSLSRTVQWAALNFFCQIGKQRIPQTSDHFMGFFCGGNLNKENLTGLIQDMPAGGITELMCHPGLAQAQSPYSHWDYNWQGELDALMDKNIRGLIEKKDIQLTSYRNLSNSGRVMEERV